MLHTRVSIYKVILGNRSVVSFLLFLHTKRDVTWGTVTEKLSSARIEKEDRRRREIKSISQKT